MATNFPGSQDSFTNPTSSSAMNSPSHSSQHSDANDAIEAIELALLDGAPVYIDDADERLGIGTTNPATDVHIFAGSSGVTSQNSAARLIVEDASSAGIAINTENTGNGYVRFVDPDSNSVGGISYSHTDDELKLRTGGSDRLTISDSTRGGVAYTPSTTYISGGTWDFEYVLIDKFLTVTGEWTFTSGASVSSFWRIGLPSGLTWDTDCVGTLNMTDFMFGGDNTGFSAGFAGGSDIFAYRIVQSGSTAIKGASVTNTLPFTWGTSDSFKITISGVVS